MHTLVGDWYRIVQARNASYFQSKLFHHELGEPLLVWFGDIRIEVTDDYHRNASITFQPCQVCAHKVLDVSFGCAWGYVDGADKDSVFCLYTAYFPTVGNGVSPK